MGYLAEGETLNWEDSKKYIEYIKKEGIKQFLNVYQDLPTLKQCPFKYGDELEYTILKIDKENKTISVSLRADKIIEQLNKSNTKSIWHPEYANYMVEGTPDEPYKCSIKELLSIENDLKKRRLAISSILLDGEVVVTMSSFPRLGCPLSSPLPSQSTQSKQYSLSDYLSDEIINPHVRFRTLTENIRLRRGEKVNILQPVFRDEKTDPNLDYIHMDCMCFGMGCSCLQTTIQMPNLETARYIYDMLAVVSPIFLALTAASPVHRGYLLDTDCRWNIISQAVDDRFSEEKDRIKKSRYASISYYVGKNSKSYNDSPQFDPNPTIDELLKNNVDDLLRQHLNYIFIRDPLVVFRDGLPINPIAIEDTIEGSILDKYENIHSTNWNTVRLKIPVPEVCGWRVELRPMEIQADDFANASFLVFANILVRTLMKFRPKLYIPISKLDYNMEICQKRDAILNEKIYFNFGDNEIKLVTIRFVCYYLLNIITGYIETNMDTTSEEKDNLMKYIDFVRRRASGKEPTDAKKIRDFIQSSEKYNKDSYVSNELCIDITNKIFLYD